MPEDSDNAVLGTQQELQQSLMYLEYIKEQIAVLKEQYEILELAIKEHRQAIDTLKDFENLGKDNEILVPIGADSLVFAKVIDHSKVILNIGSGLAMEENLDNAIGKLNERIENIENNKNKIESTIGNLQQQATMLTSQIEEKYDTLPKS
ncbi:prefoldin subunit alpha [[Eubacterium] cellulosolvens]